MKKHSAERGSKQKNYPLSVGSNIGVHSFCLSPLCDWSGKFEPPSKPIKCKTLKKCVFVTPVFLRFRQCAFFTLSFHWLLVIFHLLAIGCCGYLSFGITTLNRKAGYLLAMVHGVRQWLRESCKSILSFLYPFSYLRAHASYLRKSNLSTLLMDQSHPFLTASGLLWGSTELRYCYFTFTIDRLTIRCTSQLTDTLTFWPSFWLSDRQNHRLIDRPTDRPTIPEPFDRRIDFPT